VDFEQVLSIVRSRDKTDSTRTIAPLVVPENALVIDTTGKSAREVADEIVLLIEKTREQSENMEESDVL
jgi:cytidylate kinase